MIEPASEPILPIQSKVADIFTSIDGLAPPRIQIRGFFDSNYISFSDNERLTILNWLSNISFRKHHELYRSFRIEETGGWLRAKEKFRDWNGSDESALLWLRGAGRIVPLAFPKY